MNLLYVYKSRIPVDLRELVISKIPKEHFEIDTMTYSSSDEEKIDKLKRAKVVLFAPGRYLPDEILKHGKHIKLMQLWSSGYEKFNCKGAKKYGIPVANNGGANAISVAEHTILLMLAVYKLLPSSHLRTVTGNWAGNSHGMDMYLLQNKKLGLIGLGNIGSAVAQRASAFGVKIIYYDINRLEISDEKEKGYEYVELEDLLRQADIISLHLHLNKNTKNIIGEMEFSLMKSNAVLINVSRAGLVDQVAFKDSVLNNKIWGAGLDVYPNEPTLPDDPILNHPRIVATPHIAGSTVDVYNEALDRCVENLLRVKNGFKPQYIVN